MPPTQTTLREDLDELARLKNDATRLNREAEDAKRERDTWQKHCMDRMEAEGFDSLKAGGRNFSCVRDKHYAKMQDRQAFVAWAEENAPDLIQVVEKAGDLNSLVRAYIADGEELPPGVGFYNKDYISVNNSK